MGDANTAMLRGARATGRTPGKKASEEPAAAPLGTDDEAAGTRLRHEAVEREIERAERNEGLRGLKATEAMRGRPGRPEESARNYWLVTVAAAVVAVLVIAIVAWIAM